jgi:hypothetical protein
LVLPKETSGPVQDASVPIARWLELSGVFGVVALGDVVVAWMNLTGSWLHWH